MENPEEIKRSWQLQGAWATGPKVINKLVPPTFSRIAVPFVQTWREQAEPTLDWGAQNHAITIPEGVRCISAAYLKINLPSAEYKAYPGLYAIDTFRLRSAGQQVYSCDAAQFYSDHCESLLEQKLKGFAEIYLGGAAESTQPEERVVKLPLFLPNSTYMRRSSMSTGGHGVMGTFTGTNRIELNLTLNQANFLSKQVGVNDPGSILGRCSIMYHVVEVPNEQRRKYEDHRGYFNTVIRRFTQLSSGWTHYPNPGTLVIDSLSQPNGCVTEVMLLAVPHAASAAERRRHNYIKATHFEVVADMITQKLLDSKSKISTELFTNGFNPPANFDSPARLCFANHCSTDSTSIYLGGYDMSAATTVQFRFKFDEACDYRLVAVQYANCKIDSSGILTSTLEGI